MKHLRSFFRQTLNTANYIEFEFQKLKSKFNDNFYPIIFSIIISSFFLFIFFLIRDVQNGKYLIINVLNIFNITSFLILIMLFSSLLFYKLYPDLKSIDIKDYQNKSELEFKELFVGNSFIEVKEKLLEAKIISTNGKWISEELKRQRDLSVLIAVLIINGLLNQKNYTTINYVAVSYFKKKFDYHRMTDVIKDFMEDNISKNDKKTYQKLLFLNDIRI